VNLWDLWTIYAWPAVLFTVIGLVLHRASRHPKTPRGDAVLMDLCLGLVAVVACVFWLQVVASLVF
jgi:hypothetical protein